MFEKISEAFNRNAIAQKVYILAFCLVYLMHNIWLARTVLWFVVVPIMLLSKIPYRSFLPILTSNIFLTAMLFLCMTLVASLLGGETPISLAGRNLRYSLMVLFFLAITAHLAREREDFLPQLMLFLVPAAAILAIVDVASFNGGFSLENILTTRLEGVPGLTVYYNSNVIGGMFAVPCVGAVALIASKKLVRWQFILLFACSLILLGAIVLTGSRGSLLSAFAGIGICGLLAASWRQMVVTGGLVAIILGFISATPLLGSLVGRGDSLRFTLWPIYLHMAALKPLLGYGLAFDTRVALPDGSVVMNGHNIILCAMVRSGIFAALALIGLLASTLYRGWCSWRRHAELIPLALPFTFIVASSVDYEILPTDLSYLWILFWLPVGITLGASLRIKGATQSQSPLLVHAS